MTTTTLELAELGARPVSADAACGTSARDEPSYVALKEEMDKLQSPAAPPVNWEQVIDLSAEVLRTHSKDLQVAAYLCCALFEQHGYEGLATGFVICRDLIRDYWDGLFPQRERGRRAALDWLSQRLEGAISRIQPTAGEAQALEDCTKRIGELSDAVNDSLGAGKTEVGGLALALRELYGKLEQELPKSVETADPPPSSSDVAAEDRPAESREQAAPAAAVEPPATSQVEPPAGSAATSASTAAPATRGATDANTFTSESEAVRALRGCQGTLRQAALLFFNQGLTNPMPYRLNRIGAWMLVTQAPQSQDKTTQLAGVQAQYIKRCEDMLQEEKYAQLILDVETGLAQAPYWLDAHHYTVRALDALGPAYAEARQVVVDEAAHFIRRVPTVVSLKFADGLPFASDTVRAWLETEVMPSAAPSPAARQVARAPMEITIPATLNEVSDLREEEAQAMAEAQQLAEAEKIGEGLAVLQERLKQAGSQREQFRWRFQQARYCVQAGLIDIALPQMEHLVEEIDRFSLEAWEPDLSRDVFQLLLQGYYLARHETPEASSDLEAKIAQAHARLCRLDVTAALALTVK